MSSISEDIHFATPHRIDARDRKVAKFDPLDAVFLGMIVISVWGSHMSGFAKQQSACTAWTLARQRPHLGGKESCELSESAALRILGQFQKSRLRVPAAQ